MINNEMKLYSYEAFGEESDEYGQPVVSSNGTIRMAIYPTSKEVQDNINYVGAQYLGLTREKINDKYVIDYNGQKLKVLYIIDKGRLIQVFMKNE